MAELLKLENLSAGYGEAVVLNDISLSLGEGETLALLGRNGTGKTTLMDTLAGATRQHGGQIFLGGQPLHSLPSHERAAAGIGWVPQERNIFKSLTVHENLTAVARPGRAGHTSRPWTPERVYEMFPRLAERKTNLGTQLSGGEQQMLAVARILRTGADILLLDEISEGLAPVIVQKLAEMVTTLRQQGYTIVMVEQNFRFAAPLADREAVHAGVRPEHLAGLTHDTSGHRHIAGALDEGQCAGTFISPHRAQAPTAAIATPPRLWPKNALTKRNRLRDSPPCVANCPISMNSGSTARS